ncbi:hypothetical protein [Pseudoxanthomonas mexicana]|uniref:hypothetical protein n=1 Tax=Pseudoxanthomonas mexicana TaxID=128785 RepID=UPI0028A8CAA8|nr:hypothetical protein [Pseudoxanthomonas mexicana]
MTTLAQDLGGVVLDGVRFEIVKVACRDEPGACGLRIHIDHQSFDIGRGFDDSEHAEWMAKQFSSALNRLVARTHSAEIAGALRDAGRWRVWRELGEHEAADIAWLNAGEERDAALDAMHQGGGGGEAAA